MAIGPPAGSVIDLYREHIQATPATYATGKVCDRFFEAAVDPASPSRPADTRCNAYSTQQTADSWIIQLRERNIQT